MKAIATVLIIASSALVACKGQESVEGAPAANNSAAPSTAAAPTAATAAVPAETEVKKPEAKSCPDPGMKWLERPAFGFYCTSSGATRMIEAKWNGKLGPEIHFTLTNKSSLHIGSGHARVFAYDEANKLLTGWGGDTPASEQSQELSGSGIVAGGIKPGETKDVQMTGLERHTPPKGAAKLEIEFDQVYWPDELRWRNPDLIPSDRTAGGVK
jgi:hypothetical protein